MNKVDSIEQGSKLIMFFDGAQETDIDIMGTQVKAIKWKNSYYPPDKLPAFHDDWNLLMSVCHKWDNLPLVGHFQYDDLCDELDAAVSLYEIEKVYPVLVKCLEWLQIWQDMAKNPNLPFFNQSTKTEK